MKKILITNDDGYDSELLQDLYTYLNKKYNTTECILIAPHNNCSGISHAITLDRPLIFREIKKNKYRVDGYPADCSMLGIGVFSPFDLVISGPNKGSNLGTDILYSGTVAAAREAALNKIPALAFSFTDDLESLDTINYDLWHAFLDKWLAALIQLAIINVGNIVNVNVSNPVSLELVEGSLGRRYYYNYQDYLAYDKNELGYHITISNNGVDLSLVELGTDVSQILKHKSVFTVFSAWPEVKLNKMVELKKIMEK